MFSAILSAVIILYEADGLQPHHELFCLAEKAVIYDIANRLSV